MNTTGAGGVSSGDVYVVDGGNNRIEVFTASGDFVRAWGMDVVASGPDNNGSGAFEVCLPVDVCKSGTESAAAGGMNAPVGVAIDQANGNVYVVDANGNTFLTNSRINVYSATGGFQGSFGWKVNSSNPEEKLQFCTFVTGCQRGSRGGGAGQLNVDPRSLPALDPATGNLFVPDAGAAGEGNFRIDEFHPILNGSEEVIGANAVKAIGWDVVASGPDQSGEIQKVKVSATSGKFKLNFGASTTPELEYNIPASGGSGTTASFQNALNALPSINAGGGSVEVTGGPGNATGSNPYIVAFSGGLLKGTDVPPMTVTKTSLVGNAVVTTYSDGGKGLESCVVARGDSCKAALEGDQIGGLPNENLGQFNADNPTSLAVDIDGAVYAVDQSENFSTGAGRVDKFTFPASGQVTVEGFAPGYLTQKSGTPGAVDPTDVTIDPATGNILVAKKEGTAAYKFLEFDSGGTLIDESPESPLPASVDTSRHGLAVGTAGRFYFSNPLGEIDIFGPPPAPTAVIKPVTLVGTTTATFNGVVTPAVGSKGEHFSTSYHFEYSRNGISWARFPASDIPVGTGGGAGSPESCPIGNPPSCNVHQEATGLEPNADYLVRLVANNGSVATSTAEPFTTKRAPPAITESVATQIDRDSAKLTGLVNPNNLPTTYHFEWGETTSYGNEVPAFDAFAGSSGQGTKVIAPIGNLKEGAIYHFRIVATSAEGTTNGPDQVFTTLDSYNLPDGRAPEQVSPNDKRPVGMVAQLLELQIPFQAAADGNGILYPLLSGLPDSTAGGNVEYLARRGSSGWESTQMTPPSLVPAPEATVGSDATGRVIYASSDLSCQMVESFEPLSPMTSALEEDLKKGVRNLYRRNSDGTYTLLSTPVPANKPIAGISEFFHVDWVSENCAHVLFDTEYHLLGEAPASGPGLYEWANGTLRLAGIRPDGSVASNAQAGSGTLLTNWNSMSADGSNVFFTATSNAGGDSGKTTIFVRKNGTATVDIAQSQAAASNRGARYQMASADGSHVFFIANYGLAAATSAGATTSNCTGSGNENTGLCDLYDYNVNTSTLSDLSADGNPADLKGAAVAGVIDVSNDGSYVYFAARGQLIANKGNSEAQNLRGNGFFNVYLRHNGALSYVGLISTADTQESAAGGSDLSFKMGDWVADATPDGKHLLFVSKANVTGYESANEDGPVAEAYLYSTADGTTVCVSCRADGAASEGNAKTQPIKVGGQEGFTAGATVQTRTRSISNDGSRVFFVMPDVLAAGANSRTGNIYEWSGGQVYLLAAGEGGKKEFTEFAGSSTNGNDAFVVTKAKLVGQDFDSTTDLYDLRAPHVPGEKVGPEPLVPAHEACDPLAHQCQGPATPQPGQGTAPASEGFSGPDSPAGKKPKPRHHKAKSHRHKKSHGKRHHKRAAGIERRASR